MTTFLYASSYFRKVLRWAGKAEKATAALCPDGDLDTHYYLHYRPLGLRPENPL